MSRTRLGIAVGLCLGAGAAFAAASVHADGSAAVGSGGRAAAVAMTADAPSPVVVAGRPATAARAAGSGAGARGTFIVVLKEPALASYKGGIGRLAAPERLHGRHGKARLDVRGASAREYVRHLQGRQAALEAQMTRAARDPVHVRSRMQHALNGMVVDMTNRDLDAVRKLPGVAFVEEYREYRLDTDHGPQRIGAPAVWSGRNPAASMPYQGEGMVAGILDTGINFESPSFAAVSPADGYRHVNPLGSGHYLGTCATGGPDQGRCNDKLIGGYDFVCGAPVNACSDPQLREEPGFGDSNSHGSHVASTVAGNRRHVSYRGNRSKISGVAPRANVIAYDVCYTNLVTGSGACPNVSAVSAVDRAVADGVVDVINYSISGGSEPWSEAVSLAFLDAVEAGIYVAASAGNSGPGPNTMGHLEPWVSSTAAAQHGRGDYAVALQVSGPQPVPEPLAPAILNPAADGVVHDRPIAPTTPIKSSPSFDTDADGCQAFPANAFAGAIAVIQRGGCTFTMKADNAAAAGAVAAIMVNNAPGEFNPSAPDTTIRVFSLNQETGAVLRDFAAAHADATGGIGYPPLPLPNVADALGAFSSRGPAGDFDLVKPDVTAPGVRILAAISGDTITGHANAVGLLNGTSMSSPHQAGAAVLVRQARPDWSVPEVKSALAMTADQTVLLEDEVTPAGPFAAGSGRIRVDKAINAGLVMDESKANYLAANPAEGGDVAALNQPSLARRSCGEGCQFVRTFRNPTSTSQSFRTSVSGVKGRVIPGTIKVAPGASVTVRVLIDSRDLPADGSWHFGKLTLTPAGVQSWRPKLRLPIAVAVQPPAASLAPVEMTLRQGAASKAAVVVGNQGGSTLQYRFDRSGSAMVPVAAIGRDVNSGYYSAVYSDQSDPRARFVADDFTLSQATRLTRLAIDYFIGSSAPLPAAVESLTWSLFPDAGGRPAGDPLTTPGTAVWSHTAAPTDVGVGLVGDELSLDLAVAGRQVDLAPGKYWLVVHARSTVADQMAWFASNQAQGGLMTQTIPASGAGSWVPATAFGGLSMRVDGLVSCGTAWIGAVDPVAGSLQPVATRRHTAAISARRLKPGAYRGNLCLVSNDPAMPRLAAPVRLTVTR